jgi:hypothetical protein
MSNPEEIMRQWDFWRKRIAEGDTSSAPRDWLETLVEELQEYQDKLQKIARIIDNPDYSRLVKEINKIRELTKDISRK